MKRIALLFSVLLLAASSGCRPSKPSSTKPAISVAAAKVTSEDGLAILTLTPQAEQRLGIATVPVVMEKVNASRTVAGELLLPLGGNRGETNSTGPSIYSLLPTMSGTELVRVAEMQTDADGKIAAAEVELSAARMNLKRAEGLVSNQAGPQRGVDDARTLLQLAEAALQTAKQRRALLGAPLFDAMRGDVLWVRVPLYIGDLDSIDPLAEAQLSTFGLSTNKAFRPARPVRVPFTAATASATVDLFYELENKDHLLRPGQRVSVRVDLREESESLSIPAAALLYDVHGGEWVYENIAPQTFTRRRVEVRFISQSKAYLARGPGAGAKIVITGAPELFGTEFGSGK